MLPVVYIKSVFEMLDDLKYKKEEGLSEKEAQFIQIFEFYMRKYLLKRKTLSFGDPLKKYSVLTRKRRAQQSSLRDQRLKRGLSLVELSRLTGLSASYLSRLESGSRRLNSDIIKTISETLLCEPADLLT